MLSILNIHSINSINSYCSGTTCREILEIHRRITSMVEEHIKAFRMSEQEVWFWEGLAGSGINCRGITMEHPKSSQDDPV